MEELTFEEGLLLEKLREHHVGKENAITAKNLRHIATRREITRIVHSLRVKGYPICSGQDGYYYAKNSAELKETMNFLKSYLKEIEEAYNGIRDTYYMMKTDELTKK